MDGNNDIEEVLDGTTKLGRMHFGISAWTLFILYVKAQQRKDRLWNVVSGVMQAREKFMTAIRRQHPGYFNKLTDKMLVAKCKQLNYLLQLTMGDVTAAFKNGSEITEGKELTFDIVLGKNGLNIPEKDQTARSADDIEDWQNEIKTHLLWLAKDEMRPPDLTGTKADFTKAQYNKSRYLEETSASSKKARGDDMAIQGALKEVDLVNLYYESEVQIDDNMHDAAVTDLPEPSMHHTFAKMQQAVGAKVSGSKRRKFQSPKATDGNKRQRAANKHQHSDDPPSHHTDEDILDASSNDTTSLSSLDVCAARLLNKLSKESEPAAASVGTTKLETLSYLKMLKETLDCGAIDEFDYSELRDVALATLRRQN